MFRASDFFRHWVFRHSSFSLEVLHQSVSRSWDQVGADEFADFAGCGGTGIDGGADAADVSFDDGGDIRTADLHLLDECDVRRFEHGVRCLDLSKQALRFDQSNGFVHGELRVQS